MDKTVCNEGSVGKTPFTSQQAQGILKDLLLTLAAALWTGLAGSILFVLLVFLANGNVQAGENGSDSGVLTRYALDANRLDDALLLRANVQIEINGMLTRGRIDPLLGGYIPSFPIRGGLRVELFQSFGCIFPYEADSYLSSYRL